MTRLLTLAALAVCLAAPARARGARYRVERTFDVGGPGRWDYVTVDSQDGLLFLTRSTHTIVLEAATGKLLADIPGQERSHGVALVPSAGRGFITDGKGGDVLVFDLKDYSVLGTVATAGDSDGVVYDPASGKVLVAAGDAGALIPVDPAVDPKTGKAGPAVELGGKPEFLAVDGKGRAYVDLVDKDVVAVVDTKTMKVVARWPVKPGGAPTGMAIDPARRVLYVGCRKPAELVVMSADDGKVLASFPIGKGVDATAFDGDAFASCGDGTLTVVRETAGGTFKLAQRLKTAPGARTLGVDTRTHTLYLPTAKFGKKVNERGWPIPEEGTFRVLVVGR